MRIEAYLILDVVCEKLCDLHPDLPIFTIHDSIITIDGKENIIKNILETEIEKVIGYKQKLKIERWQ